jgi:signal transduction histidine kinase
MQQSTPALALACARVGSVRAPQATITVGVPLQGSLASLAALRRALILGVLGGGVLAAILSLLLARRALHPLKRIAATAETIRSGDLSKRIGYRRRDEVGEVANVLDACFAELEEAVERQRRFAADASHELKTPLAAIRANVELLRGWAAVEETGRETALESLEESSRRASRLVADLLHLVQLEREPTRPRVPVRLDEVVLSAVREAMPLRSAVAIRVARLDDVTVLGDPLGLGQVLLNVLDNALEASPQGSEVIVALSASSDRAAVTVTDSGPGIDPGERDRIFDRFYSKKAAAAERAGAGLGLSIARSIARDHDGDLLACEGPGAGATFELTLPLALPTGSGAGSGKGRYQAAGSRSTNRAPASLRSA